MKTYLSRLVARAQAPVSPVMAAPRPAPGPLAENPFEQTAPLTPPPPATVTSRSVSRPANPAPPGNPPGEDRAPHSTTIAPSPVKAVPPSAPAVFSSPDSSRPNPSATAAKIVSPPAPRRPAAPTIEPAKKTLQPQTETVLSPPSSTFRELLTAHPAPASSPEKLSPQPDTPVPASSTGPSAAEEEARLQHLADTFMAKLSPRAESLLSSLSSPAGAPPSAPNVTSTRVAPAPSPAPRLQPASPAPVQPPPPAPSVVIGRLSVEVVPPAAPARPAPAVSRAAPRRSTSRSLPAARSSARFGLGQL